MNVMTVIIRTPECDLRRILPIRTPRHRTGTTWDGDIGLTVYSAWEAGTDTFKIARGWIKLRRINIQCH